MSHGELWVVVCIADDQTNCSLSPDAPVIADKLHKGTDGLGAIVVVSAIQTVEVCIPGVENNTVTG